MYGGIAAAAGRHGKMTMKKINGLLAAAIGLAASGLLSAAGFENDMAAVREKLMFNSGTGRFDMASPAPVPAEKNADPDSRWWSVSFFGSGHKASTKAALKAIDRSVYPDLGAAKDILISGSNDESGHLSKELNGGPVKEIWFGNTPFSKGGVLVNYTQFKFEEAYARLGAICHLTQDQTVPVHVANIKHYIQDSFEGFYGNDVKITARRGDADREPYEYYQVVQDETRSKLPGWTDPATGLPYWVSAEGAPRFGEDVTYGPWGHYGGRKNRDVYAVPPQQDYSGDGGNNNNAWVSARPEIRQQQLNISGEVTISVLESASRRLPPLVRDLSVSGVPARGAGAPSYSVKFSVHENRTPNVKYAVSVYREGELLGKIIEGAATLFPAKDGVPIVFSGTLSASWAGVVGFQRLAPGQYTVDVRITDEDGNVTPDLVNEDSLPENDTKKTVVIE